MTEIEAEQEMSRSEVADYLREFAAQLDTSGTVPDSFTHHDRDDDHRVTFMVGNDSATINPPEDVTFEIEVESDGSFMGGEAEYEVEFEISWRSTEADGDETRDELEIK